MPKHAAEYYIEDEPDASLSDPMVPTATGVEAAPVPAHTSLESASSPLSDVRPTTVRTVPGRDLERRAAPQDAVVVGDPSTLASAAVDCGARATPGDAYAITGAEPYPGVVGQHPPVVATAGPVTPGVAPSLSLPPRYADESDEDYLLRANLRSEWSTRLLNCFADKGSCFEILCCPYFQASAQISRLTTGVTGMRVAPCVIMMVGDLVRVGTPLMAFTIRKQLRARYHIGGDLGTDCAVSFCCPYCVLCQNYREMCVRGESPGGVCCAMTPYSRAPASIN